MQMAFMHVADTLMYGYFPSTVAARGCDGTTRVEVHTAGSSPQAVHRLRFPRQKQDGRARGDLAPIDVFPASRDVGIHASRVGPSDLLLPATLSRL